MKNPNYKVDDTGVEYYSTGAIGYPLSPIPAEQQQNAEVYQSALIFRDACVDTTFPAPSDEVVHRLYLETYRHRKLCRKAGKALDIVNWQKKDLRAAIQSICSGQDVQGARQRYGHLFPEPPAPPAKKKGGK